MSTSRTRRAVIGILALLVAVLGAACEDEKPSDPPTSAAPSTSDTTAPTEPTTTPTGPVEPTLPAAAEAETKAGAEAFVAFYWEVVNYAQTSGDTDLMQSLSIDSCTGCNAGVEAIERIYDRGGRIIGGANRVVKAAFSPKPSGGWLVTVTVDVDRQRIRGAGDLDQISRPGRLQAVLGLTHQNHEWHVTSLES